MNPLEPDFNPVRRKVAEYGKYSVHLDPLVHLPWGLYRIYVGGKYVAAQISFPSLSDCEWLERSTLDVEWGPHWTPRTWTTTQDGKRKGTPKYQHEEAVTA